MPFNTPTLTELDDRIRTNIASRLAGDDSALRRSNIIAISRAQAGMAFGQYAYMDWILAQVFPDLASDEMLDRHAAIRGLTRKGAKKATGQIRVTGIDGETIAEGSSLNRSDGEVFVTNSDGTIVDGSTLLVVTAVETGETGNTDIDANLSFVSPHANIDSIVLVDIDPITGGADQESDDRLRERILKRWREPPQGGAKHDYEAWALEVADVTRAWIVPGEMGLGTITVRYVTDDEEDIFPDTAHQSLVSDHIANKKPVTAHVFVAAPTPTDLNLSLAISPITEAVKTAVIAELNDMLTRDAYPGATILLSRIREAVSIASGEFDNAVLLPAADVEHASGQMPRLGQIIWSEVS